MPSRHQPFELLVGTRNAGKVRELGDLLSDMPLKLRSLSDFPSVREVEEVGETYEENSNLKALTYAHLTGIATLADDSGLEVDALGGIPGPLSARFAGELASDQDRIQKLLHALDQHPSESRSARFVCSLSFAGWSHIPHFSYDEPTLFNVVRGELAGYIIQQPRGNNGFGYDPIFVPNGFSSTLAELPAGVKNKISHRANALAHMRSFITAWIGKLDRCKPGL